VAAEGIDQVKLGRGRKRATQHERRGSLIDAYLDHPSRALHGAEEHLGVLA
jgi:hypothetical protein